jgi:hypothetical protein
VSNITTTGILTGGGTGNVTLGNKSLSCPDNSAIQKIDSNGNVTCISKDISLPSNSKFAFVTTQLFTGNLGGLSGADAKCQQVADSSPKAWLHSRTWRAYIGDNTALPQRACSNTIDYYDTNGDLIPLRSGINHCSINYVIRYVYISETGSSLGHPYIWIGRYSTGSSYPSCNNWSTNSSGETGTICHYTGSGTSCSNYGCDRTYPIICFEQ